MGASIIRYQEKKSSTKAWGILSRKKEIRPIPFEYEHLSQLVLEAKQNLAEWQQIPATIRLDEVEILAPLTKPCKIICQGLNYADHREESGRTRSSDYNLVFRKDESSLTGPYDKVYIPAACEIFDYEIELGLLIGKEIEEPTDMQEANISEYVAAWFIANDFSARDMMFRASFRQWYLGKSARSLCPVGPVLYFPDKEDWKKFDELTLTLKVDGEIRQQATARQLIFRPAETLSYLSQHIDLAAGDCIITGTPGGVAIHPPSKFKKKIAELLFDERKQVEMLVKMNKDNPRVLRPGQKVSCHIATPDGSIDLGIMENVIA